jgi:hypothetical protein
MSSTLLNIPLILLFLLIVSSCGKTNQQKISVIKVDKKKENLEVTKSTDNYFGLYKAKIQKINPSLNLNIYGSLTLLINQEEFVSHVRFVGDQQTSKVIHIQNIYEAKECPDETLDLNKDGIIDYIEFRKKFDKILIPLDGDLNSQFLGLGTYPFSDEFGRFQYTGTASLSNLIDDLWEIDINSNDSLVKLQPKTYFNLENFIYVIHGLSNQVSLPQTARSTEKLDLYQSIPIACGKITKLRELDTELPNEETDLNDQGTPGGVNGDEDGSIIILPEDYLNEFHRLQEF